MPAVLSGDNSRGIAESSLLTSGAVVRTPVCSRYRELPRSALHLDHSLFHHLIHGLESTNATVLAFRCRVLTGLHRPILSVKTVKELSVKEQIYSRLSPHPLWPLQRGLARCRRALRLQAQRGSGPGDGPARHTRCPAATGRGGRGCRGRGRPCDSLPPEGAPSPSPACSSSKLPPIQPKPPPLPRCNRLVRPHRARSLMCLASSPRHHLRQNTAHYVARRSALHLRHFSALATRCTSLFYPQDPNFSPPSSGHFSLAERRISSW